MQDDFEKKALNHADEEELSRYFIATEFLCRVEELQESMVNLAKSDDRQGEKFRAQHGLYMMLHEVTTAVLCDLTPDPSYENKADMVHQLLAEDNEYAAKISDMLDAAEKLYRIYMSTHECGGPLINEHGLCAYNALKIDVMDCGFKIQSCLHYIRANKPDLFPSLSSHNVYINTMSIWMRVSKI